MYEVELEFPEGWGVLIKNPFRGGGMDILWTYTLPECNLDGMNATCRYIIDCPIVIYHTTSVQNYVKSNTV